VLLKLAHGALRQRMEGEAGSKDEMERDGGMSVAEDFIVLGRPPLDALFRCLLTGDILREPVTLPCQHSFSRGALEAYLCGQESAAEGPDGRQASRTCPLPTCRRPLCAGPLAVNRALAENLIRFFPPSETVVPESPTANPRAWARACSAQGDPIEALMVRL
jgi:hypothetical protein